MHLNIIFRESLSAAWTMSLRASSEDVMLVFCLLLGILLCSAELLSDKLLTQQQQQQPLFLCLSFCRSLYSARLLPFISYLAVATYLFFFPGLFFSMMSFLLPFLSCHILSLCITSYFFACTILTRLVTHLVSYSLPFLSYHIISNPILCYSIVCIYIPRCLFAYNILSDLMKPYPISPYTILSNPILPHLISLLSGYLPALCLHVSPYNPFFFAYILPYLILSYLIRSNPVLSRIPSCFYVSPIFLYRFYIPFFACSVLPFGFASLFFVFSFLFCAILYYNFASLTVSLLILLY